MHNKILSSRTPPPMPKNQNPFLMNAVTTKKHRRPAAQPTQLAQPTQPTQPTQLAQKRDNPFLVQSNYYSKSSVRSSTKSTFGNGSTKSSTLPNQFASIPHDRATMPLPLPPPPPLSFEESFPSLCKSCDCPVGSSVLNFKSAVQKNVPLANPQPEGNRQEGNRQEGNRQEGNRQEGNRNHPPIRNQFHNMFLFPQYASNARRHDDTYARRFEEEDNDADNDACAYDSAYTSYYNDRD